MSKLGPVVATGGAEAVAVYVMSRTMRRIFGTLDKRYRIHERAADWGTTVVNKIVPDPLLLMATTRVATLD